MGQGAQHEFEVVTDYCIRCGCSRIDDVQGFRHHCDEVGNVVGISHLVLLKRWRKPLDEICKELSEHSSAAKSG